MAFRRNRGFWVIPALVFCGLASFTVAVDAAAPKRVLIVHSFGNAAPPFTTHSTAFETELTAKMGAPVDLDEVSLDVARYASLDMEEALVELMRARQTKWQPDLVVPIGSPAGVFVAQHRSSLFPTSTPIVYVGMDIRRLPAGALEQNATFVGESFHTPGWVEDILQIAPGTKHIAVVIGDSPLERIWTDIIKKDFALFSDRVNFIWLNGLSLEAILQRTKSLPPHSFILHVLMMRDANGVTHDGDHALRQIRAVANAPINGIFQHQLGMGIVGGRLHQAETEGVEGARVAMHILRGEPASSFPPKIIDALPPRYDWRELRRWKIDEKHLPKDSTILFRSPTMWERSRAWIIGLAAVILIQAVLVGALIANLARRRRAERSLNTSETRVGLAAEAANLGVWDLNTATGEMWVSDKVRALFGFESGTAIDRSMLANRVHPEDRAMRELAVDRAIRTSGEYEVEYRVLLPDQTVRWISGRGRCMNDAAGLPTRILGVSVDITARKEAVALRKQAEEEARRQREQIDLLGRASVLGEMTASLAHELNQPLAAIVANASAAVRFIDGDHIEPDSLREIFADISSDGRRARDIIQSVRNAIKQGTAVRNRISLNQLVANVSHMVRPDAAAHGCRVETSLADDLPLIDGDSIQMQQVLVNLVTNAFHAMRETPPAQRRVEIATQSDGDGAVRVAVRDHGTGIAGETRERLFEHFYTTRKDGLGMGLAIVRSIVETHGGKITAENSEGGGACFTFSLPAKAKAGE